MAMALKGRLSSTPRSRLPSPRRRLVTRASTSVLPFPPDSAAFYRELAFAVGAVERACHLCVDVKRTWLSKGRQVVEKNDKTQVTVADFGVQALISLELKQMFPSIPLVAEEDSSFLRSTGVVDSENSLTGSIVSAVKQRVAISNEPLTSDDVLGAIDRGGKDANSFDAEPSTYWVLDPIDGTRGFLKGDDALYVVGLALVVNGEMAIGVMGCPNWKNTASSKEKGNDLIDSPGQGIIMIAHAGCGTWSKSLSKDLYEFAGGSDIWSRCFVDSYSLAYEAHYCIPESQTWDMMPLSIFLDVVTDEASQDNEKKIILSSGCCGSLCKYLTVATGRASVFILKEWNETVKVWDHAAGLICLQEAGGQVSDWRGHGLDLASDVNKRITIPVSGGILVTNGVLHQKLVEMISSNIPVS